MFKESCPGSREIRQPKPEDIKCHHCGRIIEIWSDETEVRCRHCGTLNMRNIEPTCLEWCALAEECVGEERYKRYMKLRTKTKK
jgi:LSD1 subclass zinc finger protein